MEWIRRNTFVAVGVFVVVVLITFAVTLIRPALSVSMNDENTVQVLTGAIALIGSLVAASVTLLGLIFKQSNDLRTTRLAEAANRRAEVDQKRLHMQAAMDTVRSISTAEGKPAPPTQVSAALIVLSKLGETGLALDLARHLWPEGRITASAAASLCDTAIMSGDSRLQYSAAVLIYNNWRKLQIDTKQVEWLDSLDKWPKDFPSSARSLIAKALEAWVEECPPKVADDFRVGLLRAASELERGEPATLS